MKQRVMSTTLLVSLIFMLIWLPARYPDGGWVVILWVGIGIVTSITVLWTGDAFLEKK